MSNLLVNLSFLLTKPTGTTNYALNLLPYLQKLTPTLLAPNLFAQNFLSYNCYITPSNQTSEQGISGHFRRLLWTQFQLPQIYQDLKSQLLFSPIPESPLYHNCRFLVMAHDFIPLRFPKRFSPLTSYHRYYIPKVLNQALHIICNSESTAKDMIDFFNIPRSKITTIPLAHDRQHFRPLHLPTRNYFLYLGRQDPYKNLQRLISAFGALPNQHDYELWLAGPVDARYTPLLKQQVDELRLTNSVKFLNYVPYKDLPRIINQAIALVFPSLWEGFGFPVLESMACGTPAIASNLASLPEVGGDPAILINPYSTEEITAAMHSIASDPMWRSHLSQQSIARANLFSWEKTGMATLEVLSRYLA